VDTDIYITDKAEIKRLPEEKPKPSKKEQEKIDLKALTENKPHASLKKDLPKTDEKDANVLGNR